MKRCSTSLAVKKMQIKTTMRYHFTPTSMPIIKKTDNHKCQKGHGEIGRLIECQWANCAATLENSLAVKYKILSTELPYDPEMPFVGIYPRQIKTCSHKNLYTNAYRHTINNSENKLKQPKYPSADEWINKMWYIPYNEILFSNKKK